MQLISKPSQTSPQEVLILPQTESHPSCEEPQPVQENKYINKTNKKMECNAEMCFPQTIYLAIHWKGNMLRKQQ